MWLIGKKKQRPQTRDAEAETIRAFTPSPIVQTAPPAPASPIVISLPHSGRAYPQSFLGLTRLSLETLRRVEDSYVDQIMEPLTHHHFPSITALFPRAYVDVNRAACDLGAYYLPKGSAVSPRARSGLGVIPTRIGLHEDIYERPLSRSAVDQRLEHIYRPYHAALSQMICHAKTKFGSALLLDCHSMPGRVQSGHDHADIVLGNCHGTSCHERTITLLQSLFEDLGYKTALNHPYAGGFITANHGAPLGNIEAIQIEINKDLYLDPQALAPLKNFAALQSDMTKAILTLHDTVTSFQDIAAQ